MSCIFSFCEQYTHKNSTYRVAQHDHISSRENAWLKSWKAQDCTIHVSCLIPCRTWRWPKAQVLSHLPHLSFRQSHQHTQDLRCTIDIYPAMFHGRVADQHKSHLTVSLDTFSAKTQTSNVFTCIIFCFWKNMFVLILFNSIFLIFYVLRFFNCFQIVSSSRFSISTFSMFLRCTNFGFFFLQKVKILIQSNWSFSDFQFVSPDSWSDSYKILHLLQVANPWNFSNPTHSLQLFYLWYSGVIFNRFFRFSKFIKLSRFKSFLIFQILRILHDFPNFQLFFTMFNNCVCFCTFCNFLNFYLVQSFSFFCFPKFSHL